MEIKVLAGLSVLPLIFFPAPGGPRWPLTMAASLQSLPSSSLSRSLPLCLSLFGVSSSYKSTSHIGSERTLVTSHLSLITNKATFTGRGLGHQLVFLGVIIQSIIPIPAPVT